MNQLMDMRAVLITFILFTTFSAVSQEKVDWKVTFDGAAEVVEFKATIEEGWHLYSQHLNNDIGPVPTSFRFEEVEGVKLVSGTKEPEPIKAYDPNFEGNVSYFKEEVTFTQKVKANKESTLKGTITYMVCNDVFTSSG